MAQSGHIVVQGATCKCQFGAAPDKLKVLTQSRRYANDKDGSKKLVATHKDIGQPFEKNTFGSCARMNGSPCKPAVTAWSDYYDKITIEDNGGKVLLEGSKATCAIAGSPCISVVHHGQQASPSAQNMAASPQPVQSQINPLVNPAESKPGNKSELIAISGPLKK